MKSDVKVPAEGEIELGAWLFLPKEEGIRPAITMAHGFAGVKEHGLERFAQAFAAAGFVVLVHDHRPGAEIGSSSVRQTRPASRCSAETNAMQRCPAAWSPSYQLEHRCHPGGNAVTQRARAKVSPKPWE